MVRVTSVELVTFGARAASIAHTLNIMNENNLLNVKDYE
jgi:hypothetical protein